jgi:RND family efflux transporter MFP subunit
MRTFLRRHLWRIFALVLALSGVGYVFIAKGRTSANASAQGANTNVNVNYESLGDIVFPVEIDTVRRGTLTKYITANGSVRAAQSVDIVARTSGFVERVPPPNGSTVSKGQVLVRFDSREAAIAVKEADDKRVQAQVEFGLSFRENADTTSAGREQARQREEKVKSATQRLRAQLTELEQLRQTQRLDAKEYTERKAALDAEMLYSGMQRSTVIQSKSGLSAAKNAVEKAQLLLEYCTIQSPFSGSVANSMVAVGQYVQAGQTLCKVLDMSSLLIDVGVLETELPFIRTGAGVEATFQAVPNETVRGTVLAINPLADPTSKTYTVTVQLNRSNQRIAPGMFASVRIVAEELKNRILLPKAALLSRDKRNVVFSLSGTTDKPNAEWHYVETGVANDTFVEITSGLEAGAVVMTEGHFTLAHGAVVRVQEKQQREKKTGKERYKQE